MRLVRRTLLLAAAGPVLGFLQVGGLYLAGRLERRVEPLSTYVWEFIAWSCWSLFLPLVAWWAERRPIAPGSALRVTMAHLGRALAVSLCMGSFFLGLGALSRLWGGRAFNLKQVVAIQLAGGTLNDILVYGVAIFSLSVFSYREQLRNRELEASRLETLLARAELDLLRSQLDPHFVFNTLHAISSAVRRDPAAAERMLSRLGDLLRLSLETGAAQEVPLGRELELLFAYLEIQRERFGDRLHLECAVAPAVLAASVPHLILQPLVENVVKHTCERSGRVRAAVSARRAGGELLIEVRDDGPGFPPDVLNGARLGIGLSNSRRRLEKLYSGGRLELANLREGGAQVTLRVPWRPASRPETPEGNASARAQLSGSAEASQPAEERAAAC